MNFFQRYFTISNRDYSLLISLTLLILFMGSCRTIRKIPVTDRREITMDRLVEEIDMNRIESEYITIKRMSIQYRDGDSRGNLRVAMSSVKDSIVVASITKLNIPVGRIKMMPESVTFINYIDKNYFETDYDHLSKLINFPLNFDAVQMIIFNNFISLNTISSENYQLSTEEGSYLLTTKEVVNESRGRRLFNRGASLNVDNRNVLTQNYQDRRVYFDMNTLNLERFILSDREDSNQLKIFFGDYQKVDKSNYPGSIDIYYVMDDYVTELRVKINGVLTNGEGVITFQIPSNYQRIYLN